MESNNGIRCVLTGNPLLHDNPLIRPVRSFACSLFCSFFSAIFELFKGSSFSFAVFFSYGAFWLGWAIVFMESKKDNSAFADAEYTTGKVIWFIQWGLLSTCFFIITLRKNICLIVVFALLCATFFLLAAATATKELVIKRVAGYFGFATALGALYTGVAELINEEWGRHVLPGLSPLRTPERTTITIESVMKLCFYDKGTNTMFLQFSGLHIYRNEDVYAIREGVKKSILEATDGLEQQKTHVIVDYKGVSIAKELEDRYWAMTRHMERHYYLSVRRFAVSSFGTRSDTQHHMRETAIANHSATDSERYDHGYAHTEQDSTEKENHHTVSA
jgi:succinate-acetate transporter protein